MGRFENMLTFLLHDFSGFLNFKSGEEALASTLSGETNQPRQFLCG
jgi:hypothetical protein